MGKDLHIAFPHKGDWYLFDHDELLEKVLKKTKMASTDSWKSGGYSSAALGPKIRPLLEPYRIRTV